MLGGAFIEESHQSKSYYHTIVQRLPGFCVRVTALSSRWREGPKPIELVYWWIHPYRYTHQMVRGLYRGGYRCSEAHVRSTYDHWRYEVRVVLKVVASRRRMQRKGPYLLLVGVPYARSCVSRSNSTMETGTSPTE